MRIVRTNRCVLHHPNNCVTAPAFVIVAEDTAAVVERQQQPSWSVGIHAGDFLVPVCHQGMNRSQVMRLALTYRY